jgi:hypothetical protein
VLPCDPPTHPCWQVLSFLRSSPVPLSLSLILNPQRDLTELPLKAFYRYALPAIEPGGRGEATTALQGC